MVYLYRIYIFVYKLIINLFFDTLLAKYALQKMQSSISLT